MGDFIRLHHRIHACKCAHPQIVYYERYDMHACSNCDRWLDPPHTAGCCTAYEVSPDKPSLSTFVPEPL